MACTLPGPATPSRSSPRPGASFDVALLLPCFWPEVRRGGERMVRELADELLDRGHRPRLITSHPFRTRRSVEDGLPIARHRRPPDGPLEAMHVIEYLTAAPASYRDLRSGADELAHAFYPTDALAAARWSRRNGRPSIFSLLGIPLPRDREVRRLRAPITARAARDCTVVTALSHAQAAELRRWFGVEARVIHPGVNLTSFTPGGARAENPTIFCAADIGEPRKRVRRLVSAFSRVRRERPTARLVLSRPRGPGQAARLGLTGAGIEFADVDGRDALQSAYREAWVTALPSEAEAFGLVLVESLACGTPVVAAADGAVTEIVDREAIGRLHPLDDEPALAGALLEGLELAGDPATAGACRERAQEFSAARCADAYESLYAELLAR